MQEEIWKPVVGYEGLYEVSNRGRVRRLWPISRHYRVLKTFLRGFPQGYLAVNLSKGGKIKMTNVHRLVAEAFIPNPNNLPQVNHKDENKANSYVENLEWCDHKYNVNYGTGISRQVIKRINNPKLSYPVGQYDKEGNLIATYPSLSEAERATGISKVSIRLCADGSHRKRKRRDGTIYEGGSRKTAGGYKWKLIK